MSTKAHLHDLEPMKKWIDEQLSKALHVVTDGTDNIDEMSERIMHRISSEEERSAFYRKSLQLMDICFTEVTFVFPINALT